MRIVGGVLNSLAVGAHVLVGFVERCDARAGHSVASGRVAATPSSLLTRTSVWRSSVDIRCRRCTLSRRTDLSRVAWHSQLIGSGLLFHGQRCVVIYCWAERKWHPPIRGALSCSQPTSFGDDVLKSPVAFVGLEDGQEVPRLPGDVTPGAEPLLPYADLPGYLGDPRPGHNFQSQIDLAEDEETDAMGTEIVPKDNAVIQGNMALQYLANGAVGVLQRMRVKTAGAFVSGPTSG